MQKIVLLNPLQSVGYSQPPIGLLLIAAVLEREGYEVAVLDANALKLDSAKIFPYVSSADVVGLTAMTPTINAAVLTARQLKQARPDLTIVIGGPHVTLLPEETLATTPEVDIAAVGEGEKTIIELLQALASAEPIDNISGISYRRDGEILRTEAQTEDIDLDSLPFLAYHLLPLRRYKPQAPHGRAFPWVAMITSRGCPFNCSFCSKPVTGYRFRAQSPERVIEEIAYYQERFGVREIAFYDDVFTLNKKRVHAIADGMLQRGLKVLWSCETRVDLVDRDLLHQMKKAGCYLISYGIESASQEILNTLNKGTTPEQAEETVRITREVGLQTLGYFMIGAPGESPKTARQTINFAKKLKLDFAQFGITIPFPGTKLYQSYLESRNNHTDIPWEYFEYEGLKRSIAPVFESNELKRADLQAWASKAYREFYLRPYYFWQRLRQLKTIGDFRIGLSGFLRLVRGITNKGQT